MPNVGLPFNYWAYCVYSICVSVPWEHPGLGNRDFPRLSGQHPGSWWPLCPAGPSPAALTHTAGISHPATSKGEGGEKGVKTSGGESVFPTRIKQFFPLLSREPEYPAAS